MPFIADAMLGKLARWLRILGADTAYEPTLTDDGIIQKARSEGRTILTRDAELHDRALRLGVESFPVRGTEIVELLKEVAPLLHEPTLVSRCPSCNSRLRPNSDPKILTTPAEKLAKSWSCPSCGKLYWHGFHWEGIRRTLILAGLGDQIGNS